MQTVECCGGKREWSNGIANHSSAFGNRMNTSVFDSCPESSTCLTAQ